MAVEFDSECGSADNHVVGLVVDNHWSFCSFVDGGSDGDIHRGSCALCEDKLLVSHGSSAFQRTFGLTESIVDVEEPFAFAADRAVGDGYGL